jgi:hypothetical protein
MIMKKGNLVKSFGRRVLVVVASTDAFFFAIVERRSHDSDRSAAFCHTEIKDNGGNK